MHPHAPLKVSVWLITRPTHLHTLSLQITHCHAPPRSCWRHPRQPLPAPLLTSPACVSRWRHPLTLGIWPLTFRLTVDFSLGLTFSVQVLLTQFFALISYLQSVFAYCVSKWIKMMFSFPTPSILCWRGVRITYLGLKLCVVFLRVACSSIIILVQSLFLSR